MPRLDLSMPNSRLRSHRTSGAVGAARHRRDRDRGEKISCWEIDYPAEPNWRCRAALAPGISHCPATVSSKHQPRWFAFIVCRLGILAASGAHAFRSQIDCGNRTSLILTDWLKSLGRFGWSDTLRGHPAVALFHHEQGPVFD